MKKLLFFLLTCFLFVSVLKAQEAFLKSSDPTTVATKNESADDQMILGYCSDDIAETGMGYILDQKHAVNGAVLLTAEKTSRYRGFKLVKIRIGLTEEVTDASVWIKSSLISKKFLATAPLSSPKIGWNEVTFEVPYIIDGSAICLGFTATQAVNSRPFSFTGQGMDNAAFLSLNSIVSWTNMQKYGCLSLQAVVEGENVSQYDLNLSDLSSREFNNEKDGATFTSTVTNNGKKTITSYEVSYKIGNHEPIVETVNTNLAYRQTEVFSRKLPLEGLSKYNDLTVAITKVDNNEDENTEDNTETVETFIYSQSFPRKMLLEHFTTEPCSSCPFGDAVLKLVTEDRDDIVWISHHVGYGEDPFTVEESNDYLPFYIESSRYAPAAMLDRTTMPNNNYPVFKIGFTPASRGAEIVNPYIEFASWNPAFVSVNIEGEYNAETSSLAVNITGEKVSDFDDFAHNPFVTVYLTEDGLPGNQVGVGKVLHEHVLRDVITSTSGNEMIWDGNRYSCTVTSELKSTWDVSNMKIIAFVNNWDERDYNNAKVLNTQVTTLLDMPGPGESIQSLDDNSDLKVLVENNLVKVVGEYNRLRVFTIGGCEVENVNLELGLYIVKIDHNDSSFVKKVVVK